MGTAKGSAKKPAARGAKAIATPAKRKKIIAAKPAAKAKARANAKPTPRPATLPRRAPTTPPKRALRAKPRTVVPARLTPPVIQNLGFPRTLSLPAGVLDEPVHTWNAISDAVGSASADDLASYAITVPPDELTELGTHIRSERILNDARRWCSQLVDFEERASRPAVTGYATGMLRVLVRECITLRGMIDTSRTEAGARDLAAAGTDAAAAALYNRVLVDIDTLDAALHSAARGDASLEAQIGSARGKAGSYAEAAATLRTLSKLASTWLQNDKTPLARRLDAGGLDHAALAAMASTADGVESLGEIASGPRPAGLIPQAAIDHQDGVVLTHMRFLMNVLEAAHAKDATVPRLVPVSTRRIFTHAQGSRGRATGGASSGGARLAPTSPRATATLVRTNGSAKRSLGSRTNATRAKEGRVAPVAAAHAARAGHCIAPSATRYASAAGSHDFTSAKASAVASAANAARRVDRSSSACGGTTRSVSSWTKIGKNTSPATSDSLPVSHPGKAAFST